MKSITLRLLAFLQAAILVALLFTACTTAGTGSTSTSGNEENSSSEEPSTNDPGSDESTTAEESGTESGTETDSDSQSETTTGEEPSSVYVPRPTSDTYRVLFIGNSFTYYNDMPTSIFSSIAKAAGYNKVQVTAITKGGYYLSQFADPNDDYGLQVKIAFENVKYDIVIVQEQSNCPISNPGRFYDGVRALYSKVKENGAEMYLYATWGYEEHKSNLNLFGTSTEDMEMKLRAAYTAIAEELNINVAYVGAAMTYALKNSSMNLYHTDYYHPSPIGSHIAALTLFSAIFGVDPATINYQGALTTNNLADVRAAAGYATSGKITVEESYKTSSVGIGAKGTSFSSGVDITKTVVLSEPPKSAIISYITSTVAMTSPGWRTVKNNASTYFSGIRGDKDLISSTAYSDTALTEEQKKDIADIGYGVSVIGIEYMDSTKKGASTAVENLCNGHWGSSLMAAMYFDKNHYAIDGTVSEDSKYTALITLNFGSIQQFDAIGYCSGSLKGFAQAQDVYVSDDGVTWTKVESACYDVLAMEAAGSGLTSLSTKPSDPWNANSPTVEVLFSMAGYSGKYIRIGIILGGDVNSIGINALPNLERQQINTREIIVYGTKKD